MNIYDQVLGKLRSISPANLLISLEGHLPLALIIANVGERNVCVPP